MRAAIASLAGAMAVLTSAAGAAAQIAPPLGVPAAPPPAASPTPPLTPAPAADAPPESLKMAADPTSRLTLAVMIDGRGPFDFLVDTGSDRTVISRELAASLALPAGPPVRLRESMGVDDANTVLIDRLVIGKRVIRHIEAPALAAKDLGAAGMLGVDALRDLHVVMDFRTMRMSSSPSRAEAADPHTIVVHGKNHFGQLILTHSRIRGVPIVVVVDSGAQLSVGNPALLSLLTRRVAGHDPAATTQIVSVTGRTVTVELDDVAEADVGGLVIHHMPLGFAPLAIFGHLGLADTPALFLGMDVLSQCQRVSVDMRRREATFTLN
ncbi:MAG TPA: retroviral-like aspartic protease family protein [Caulobacteraceae bacterium]|nr:retroviral-like aspartic protease family protein [Caulobacteraceae bacterium]